MPASKTHTASVIGITPLTQFLKRGIAVKEAAQPLRKHRRATTIPQSGFQSRFYRSNNQLPAFEDYAMRGRTYRYFDGRPLYPFGFGLSYPTFRFSDLQVESKPGKKATINVSDEGRWRRSGTIVCGS